MVVRPGLVCVSGYVLQGMFGRGPEERKTLLKHVTMAVHPGEVAYVMGPSGAGQQASQTSSRQAGGLAGR